MNRLLTLLVAIVCLAFVGGPSLVGQDQVKDKKKAASLWMKAKTEYSRQILLGLTEGDYDKIKKNAKALNLVNLLEGWMRADRKDYRQQVTLFATANQELIRQAEAKNLYGATLAYNQLTISCVQCHRIIRDVKKNRPLPTMNYDRSGTVDCLCPVRLRAGPEPRLERSLAMSLTGHAPFDSTIQTTNVWLNDIVERLEWMDRPRAYHALRAVLHALRDWLPVDQAAALAAQLPMLVRGFYYEGWHPHGKPVKERHKEDFLAHVAAAFRDDPDVDPEAVTRAVFAVLADHVTSGEVEGVKHSLPAELRSLWP
jgi:uncharacterized protein (DUF2267 family)